MVCRWRKWGDTATAWLSAQLVLRVRPTTSAMTRTQSTSAGTGPRQRCVYVLARARAQQQSHVDSLFYTPASFPLVTVPGCVAEGELSRRVLLQPGGTACSAVLQPGPHPPESQKQLHVPAQRCSSTDQVCFCFHSVFGKTAFSSFLLCLVVECPRATMWAEEEAAWIKLQMTFVWVTVWFAWLKGSCSADERFDISQLTVFIFQVSLWKWLWCPDIMRQTSTQILFSLNWSFLSTVCSVVWFF